MCSFHFQIVTRFAAYSSLIGGRNLFVVVFTNTVTKKNGVGRLSLFIQLPVSPNTFAITKRNNNPTPYTCTRRGPCIAIYTTSVGILVLSSFWHNEIGDFVIKDESVKRLLDFSVCSSASLHYGSQKLMQR